MDVGTKQYFQASNKQKYIEDPQEFQKTSNKNYILIRKNAIICQKIARRN